MLILVPHVSFWCPCERSFIFFFSDLCIWVLCLHICMYIICMFRVQKRVAGPGTIVTDSCILPCGCWELTQGPLQERQVFFPSESSLWPSSTSRKHRPDVVQDLSVSFMQFAQEASVSQPPAGLSSWYSDLGRSVSYRFTGHSGAIVVYSYYLDVSTCTWILRLFPLFMSLLQFS